MIYKSIREKEDWHLLRCNRMQEVNWKDAISISIHIATDAIGGWPHSPDQRSAMQYLLHAFKNYCAVLCFNAITQKIPLIISLAGYFQRERCLGSRRKVWRLVHIWQNSSSSHLQTRSQQSRGPWINDPTHEIQWFYSWSTVTMQLQSTIQRRERHFCSKWPQFSFWTLCIPSLGSSITRCHGHEINLIFNGNQVGAHCNWWSNLWSSAAIPMEQDWFPIHCLTCWTTRFMAIRSSSYCLGRQLRGHLAAFDWR